MSPKDADAVHDAFISYSRKDSEFAAKLEAALEAYRLPKELAAGGRHLDVFRDVADFTGVEYGSAVRRHLAASRKLIVVCSPHARASRYVDEEIRVFAESKGAENIVPILVSGIPNNEATAEQQQDMAFPAALCEVLAMPLAVDYRGFDVRRERIVKRPFEKSWYALLANLLDASRDRVEERERQRQTRRRRIVATAGAAIIIVLATALAFSVVQWRRAEQRAAIALSRQLALQARSLLDDRLDAALLLALQSYRIQPTTEARGALLAALNHSPRLVRFLHGSLERAQCSAFSTDGRWLATAGCSRYKDDVAECTEGIIEIFDIVLGRPARPPLRGHGNLIDRLAFRDDGTLASVSSWDGTLVIWDVARGDARRNMTLRDHRWLAPDTNEQSGDSVTTSAFGAGGRLLAAGSARGAISLWNVDRGTLLGSVRAFGGSESDLDEMVDIIAFRSDGMTLAAGSASGAVAIIELEPRPRVVRRFQAHQEPIIGVSFTPDGGVVSIDRAGSTRRWNVNGTPASEAIPGDPTTFTEVMFSPDGKTVAGAVGDGTLRLWNAATGASLGDPIRVGPVLRYLTFSADGALLATLGDQRTIAIWNVARDRYEYRAIQAHRRLVETLAVAPSTREVVLSSGCAAELNDYRCPASEIRFWDARTGQAMNPPIAPIDDPVEVLGFIGAESIVGFSQLTGMVRVWDLASRRERRSLDVHSRDLTALRPAAALTADGRTLAVGGCGRWKDPTRKIFCAEGEIRVIDVATGRLHRSIHGHAGSIQSLAFDPGGRMLASGAEDGGIQFWDWQTGRVIAGPTAVRFDEQKQSSAAVATFGFVPDGTLLMAGSDRAPGKLVWLDGRTALRRGPPVVVNEDGVFAMAIRPGGGAVATIGDGNTVVIHDLAGRQLLYPPLRGHTSTVMSLHFTADGSTLVSGDEAGVLRWWRFPAETLEERACRMANRELTDRERADYLENVEPVRCSEVSGLDRRANGE